MPKTFVARYEIDHPELREQHLDEHRAYLRSLHENGSLVAAGPVDAIPGGLLILEAESEEQARTLAANDPFRRFQVSAELDLYEWRQTIGGL